MDRQRSAEGGGWWRKPKVHKFEDLKDRAQRSQGDEHEYFKVDAVCLGCGVKSRVKISRLGQKLRCKNCRTVMHMAAGGGWRLGPPPEESKGGWILSPEKRYWGLNDLARYLPFLRSKVFLVAIAAAAVLAVGVAVANRTGGVQLPPALLGRAVFLCDALLEGNRSDFRPCVPFTTRGNALRVYDEVQARLARSKTGRKAEYTLDVVYEHDERGAAAIVVEFFASATQAEGETRPQTKKNSRNKPLFAIVLFWTKSSGGEWLLDGDQTAADLQFGGGSSRRS